MSNYMVAYSKKNIYIRNHIVACNDIILLTKILFNIKNTKMKDVIKKEQIIRHSIETVWKAITNQEEISTWFIKADFKAEQGYKYTFTAPKEQNCPQITGVVKKATPYTLIYTWVVANTDIETTVKWQLEKVEEGTKLYLEHSGISNYKGETAVAMFNSFNEGWDNCISGLLNYVKKTMHAG